MKAKIFFTLVILAAFCCCSSDSTVESQGFGLTVNANGKMLSETYQKLDALSKTEADNKAKAAEIEQKEKNLKWLESIQSQVNNIINF